MKLPQVPPKIDALGKKSNAALLLLKDDSIRKFVNKCNKEYVHWDELRRKKIPNNAKPEQIWLLMKIFRRLEYQRPISFSTWKFVYALPDDILRKLHLLDKGTAGHLDASMESISNESKERFIVSSLMEESIASSQMEGAATTRKVAKQVLRLRRKPKNYSEQMIVNNYNTMKKIVEMKTKSITIEDVLKLHGEITRSTLKDNREGCFRDNNEVVVGDSLDVGKVYYTPPDYKKVPDLMDEFCKFASIDEDEFIHPVIKGIILHFLIGYIHPFNDGNGRTARAIFYWYLLSRGYWLFEFMSVSRAIIHSKKKYELAYLYTEKDDNDLTYFINYNLTAIEKAFNQTKEYIERKKKEISEATRLIQGISDINYRQAEILRDFVKHPEKDFVISEIRTSYKIAYDTARKDMFYLEKLGYVKKTKIKNKYAFRFLKMPEVGQV